MTEQPSWREMAEALQSVLRGTKVEALDRSLGEWLILCGLLSREEVKKPCPTCGTERHDFSWWKVTPAGRLLVDALGQDPAPVGRNAQRQDAEERLGPKDEHAVTPKAAGAQTPPEGQSQ